MSGESPKTRIMTPANTVTLLRICLVPVFVVALLSPWPEWFNASDIIGNSAKALVAAGVFIVISCTDWIDGYLARSRNEVTDFGKFLDPLADKILVAAALISLVDLQVIPGWPVIIILAREFIVSGIRMIAATKGFVIAASWYGKAKTVFQILAIILFLVKDSLYLPDLDAVADNPLYVISWIVMLIALILTVLSMLDYVSKARSLLFPKDGDFAPASDAVTDADSCSESDAASRNAPFPPYVHELAAKVVSTASGKGIRICTAESLTGGLIAASLTSIPGSSTCIMGGAVTYDSSIKHEVLGVDANLLEREGAVNDQTAMQMAANAATLYDSDICISVTGIAGPAGAEPGKPVGTVYFGISAFGNSRAKRMNFSGDREEVRMQTVTHSLELLLECMD